MIISHDSYTYQKPKNILLKPFSCFWRAQKLNIDEQYNKGVRVFDIRVHRSKNKWETAHGLAYFDKKFSSLIDICKLFKGNYPGSMIRIFLEDKKDSIKDIFMKEAKEAFEQYIDVIWELGTHYPWEVYFKNPNLPWTHINDYCCHLFNWDPAKSWTSNIKNFELSSCSISSYAKKHNIKITQEMIDNNVGYMFDYVGIYP